MIDNIKISLKFITGRAITKTELKKMAGFIASYQNHIAFEYLLKKYDPSLDLSYSSDFSGKTFIPEGRGWGTLKPYRILENKNKNKKFFEKIFFSTSKNLASAVYFDDHYEELAENKSIKSPRIVKMIQGEILTILHYEYWDLDKLPPDTAYPVLKAKTLELCQGLSQHYPAKFEYPIGKKIYNPKPDLFVEEFGTIRSIARSFPVYFQHLDLGEENVYKNDVVIDWDNSGYYNLGVDFGRLLLAHYILKPDKFLSTYKEELKDYHRKSNSVVPYEDFKPVVMYYFLVLFHGHHDTEHSVKKIESVIRDFKEMVSSYKLQNMM